MRRQPLLPPAYFAAAMCLMLALHFLLPLGRMLAWPWRLAGIAPAAAGVALNLAADRAFKRRNTTVKPFERPSNLVTEGVFGLSRNPMYLGMVMILLGLALGLGSLSPFLACLGFAVLLHYRFIPAEQRMLDAQFGAAWRSYRARVRRWI